MWIEEATPDDPIELDSNYKEIVEKIIAIIKLFRKSPKKYEGLQDLMVANLKKEYALLKNCPTRWNALLKLLKRFIDVKVPIQHALVDLKKTSLFPSEDEITIIEDMVKSLMVVDSVSVNLQDRSATLAEADRMFEFALSQLNNLAEKSHFGLLMRDSFLSRILYRRPKGLVTLMSYLENKRFLKETDQVLPKASREEMIGEAVQLYVRLFNQGAAEHNESQGSFR